MSVKEKASRENGAEAAADAEINARLRELNALIQPYRLAWVDPSRDCALLKTNARWMTKEMQNRLTENVRRDGFLSQLPFCVRQPDGRFRVLSGNHRVVAAQKSGLSRILVMFLDEEDLPHDRQVAIQLSHNSISGQDDEQILKELYESISDIAEKAYSGVDARQFLDMKLEEMATIGAGDFEINEITFCFADVAKAEVEACLEELEKRGVSEKDGSVVVGPPDEFIEVMTAVKRAKNIKNHSVAFYTMCAICRDWLASHGEDDLRAAGRAARNPKNGAD